MRFLNDVNGNPVNIDQVAKLQVGPIGGGSYRVLAKSAEGTEIGQFERQGPMDGPAASDLLSDLKVMIGAVDLAVLWPS